MLLPRRPVSLKIGPQILKSSPLPPFPLSRPSPLPPLPLSPSSNPLRPSKPPTQRSCFSTWLRCRPVHRPTVQQDTQAFTCGHLLHPQAIPCGPGRSLTGEKKNCSGTWFFQKRPRVAHVFNHGWWRLAVGGWWRLPVGGWWLAAVGGGWRQLAVGDGWLVAVGSG